MKRLNYRLALQQLFISKEDVRRTKPGRGDERRSEWPPVQGKRTEKRMLKRMWMAPAGSSIESAHKEILRLSSSRCLVGRYIAD